MNDIFLILDNIRSLYNIGSIFRLADATSVKEVYLCGISGVEKIGDNVGLNPRLKKTALSAFEAVSWKYFGSTEAAIKDLKKKGVSIVAVELSLQSKNYLTTNYKLPVALLVGHEREGVADKVIKLCEDSVQIPMLGQGKSLNVVTSLAVVLYEVIRQNQYL